jgi:hypothetical protein
MQNGSHSSGNPFILYRRGAENSPAASPAKPYHLIFFSSFLVSLSRQVATIFF